MKFFIQTVVTLFLFVPIARGQQQFVQCIILGLENEEQCRLIEHALQMQEGLESVRADSYSGNLLVFFSANFNYTEEHFRVWLRNIGYEFYCFKLGDISKQHIKKLSRMDCDRLEKK